MGVVALPSRVTGLAAISISDGDHVHARVPGKFEFFPVGPNVGVGLALDFEDYSFLFSHFAFSS